MDGEVLRCKCGHIVGIVDGDIANIKWKGRQIVVRRAESVMIVCERCKAETKIVPAGCKKS